MAGHWEGRGFGEVQAGEECGKKDNQTAKNTWFQFKAEEVERERFREGKECGSVLEICSMDAEG